VLLETPSPSDLDNGRESSDAVGAQGMQSATDTTGKDSLLCHGSIKEACLDVAVQTASTPEEVGLPQNQTNMGIEIALAPKLCDTKGARKPSNCSVRTQKRKASDQLCASTCSTIAESTFETGTITFSPAREQELSFAFLRHEYDEGDFNDHTGILSTAYQQLPEQIPNPLDVKRAFDVIGSHIYDFLSQ
jgi:hypothetical protein